MTDILETMADEIAEAVEILRPHHPQDSEAALRHRAEGLRSKRYQSGRWPTSDELAEKAWEEAWEEAHVEDAIREAAKAARCEPERARANIRTGARSIVRINTSDRSRAPTA